MDFISENIIESVVEEIGASEENFTEALLEFNEEQPLLNAYILSENFDILTQPEKEYFLFLTLVLFFSVKNKKGILEEITAEAIGKAEEINWTMLSEVKSKKFKERMDVFFENYEQEDLLAFVEDSLIDDEDEIVTKVGREPMFVALKSIIDCISMANN